MENIMSFAYYSSGEKDDETGEYIKPEKWDKNVNINLGEIKESKQEVSHFPPEFDPEYYIEKQNNAKIDSEKWDWIKYAQYAQAVFNMYKNVAYKFYTKYADNIKNMNLPDFVLDNSNQTDIDILAKKLDNSEKELIAQFSRYGRTVSAKINRHKRLENLQNYAVFGWIMYHILNHSLGIPLNNSIRFKSVYENMNEDNAIDLIRIYRGCKILQRNYRIYVRNNFMEKQGHYLYKDIDIKEKYDELVKNLNGITSKECEAILQRIRPKIASLKNQNSSLKNLIDFYHRYDDIQRTIYEINRINNEWIQNKGWYVFCDSSYSDGQDVYKRGENYKRFCEQVKNNCSQYDEIFVKDIEKLLNELNEALISANIAHKASHID